MKKKSRDFAYSASSTGSFVYLRDNHTSVLGLREIAIQQNAEVHCLEHSDAFEEFKSSPISQQDHCANALFVYPAQCNFSGCKYPLTWVEKLHHGSLDDFVTRSTKKRRLDLTFTERKITNIGTCL